MVITDNSWYFRNALVRANYNDLSKEIYATKQYLILFFENLMLGRKNELKNRYLHIDYETNVGVNVGVNLTDVEQEVLSAIQKNNEITATAIASQCKVSTRTIERALKSLKEKKRIERIGSDKTGHWIVK